MSCKLLIEPFGISEYSIQDKLLQEYLFSNITSIGYDQRTTCFTFEHSNQLKIFSVEISDSLLSKMNTKLKRLGHSINFHHQNLSDAMLLRSTFYKSIGSMISYFEVNKVSPRSQHSSSRKLYISERHLIEKDAAGFEFISAHQLSDIFCLRRSMSNPREFAVEYSDDSVRTYTCSDRDTLLATLIDTTHSIGNTRVCVKAFADDGIRLLPKYAPKAHESALTYSLLGSSSIELWFLNALAKQCRAIEGDLVSLVSACKDFNANVTCPGISASIDTGVIRTCTSGVLAALDRCLNTAAEFPSALLEYAPVLLQSLYRLIPCVAGYKAVVSDSKVDSRSVLLQLMLVDNEFINFWTIEVLLVLVRCPLLPRDLQQEYINRHTLLTEDIFRALVELIGACLPDGTEEGTELSSLEGSVASSHQDDRLSTPTRKTKAGFGYDRDRVIVPNALVVISASSLLESVLSSGRDSSSPELSDMALDLLTQSADTLLHMLKSSSVLIVENSAILIHVLLRRRKGLSSVLCERALIEGLLLRHFLYGYFTARMCTQSVNIA